MFHWTENIINSYPKDLRGCCKRSLYVKVFLKIFFSLSNPQCDSESDIDDKVRLNFLLSCALLAWQFPHSQNKNEFENNIFPPVFMSNLKISIIDWKNIGAGTLWSSLVFVYRKETPINIIAFLDDYVSIWWDLSQSVSAVSEEVTSDNLSGAHILFIVTFEDVNFVIRLEDGTTGTYPQRQCGNCQGVFRHVACIFITEQWFFWPSFGYRGWSLKGCSCVVLYRDFLCHLCKENREVPLRSNSCTMLLSIKRIKDLSIPCWLLFWQSKLGSLRLDLHQTFITFWLSSLLHSFMRSCGTEVSAGSALPK